jgi:antitoxin ParD1/3/4
MPIKHEVLSECRRLTQRREVKIASLDCSIARGLANADAGRVANIEEVFDRLEAKFRRMVHP